MSDQEIPSDELLRKAVVETLAAKPQTAQLELLVGVVNAVVHLAGFAPTLALWQLAGELAAQQPGVRGVVNRIEAPGAPAPARKIQLDL